MSSDSEDDCYGNAAQKLQSMKNKYSEDKIETTNLLIADLKEKTDNSWRKNDSITSENDCDLSQKSQNSEAAEDYTLDAIIAKNSKKRATRSSKRVADQCVDKIIPERKKRTKKNDPGTSQKTLNTTQSAISQSADPSSSRNTENSTQSINQNAVPSAQSNTNDTAVASVLPTNNDSVTEEPAPSRGRGRGRGRQTTPRGSCGRQSTLPEALNSTRARGRSRRPPRGRRNYWASQELEPALYDFMAAIAASAAMVNSYAVPGAPATATNYSGPIYSVGNTDEYPDQCGDQPLFNSAPKPTSDVIIVEENETDSDNEELSVKVYWQSSEHVKFNIRRFQKLTEIFDHFAAQESVSHDKLFFTYNDRILRSDDTPDSINYSIVKFIDGGIINQSVSSIVKKDIEDGIKLKFQCQNVKKPFVISIRPDDKMSVVMMKCAEHLEKPLDKLKFHFDGDLITGKHTARELELEGGECIDVGIIS